MVNEARRFDDDWVTGVVTAHRRRECRSVAVSPDRLRGLPLFSSLSDDALEAAARLFAERQVESGTCLTVEGASRVLERDLPSVAQAIVKTTDERVAPAVSAD